MYGLSDYQFWLAFLIFIIACFISFYVPGILFLRRVDAHPSVRNSVLAICLGFILWTAQGYILGYAHVRWLSYIYVAVLIVLAIREKAYIAQSVVFVVNQIKKHKLATSIIFFGMVFQSVTIFASGLMTADGMRFYGINGTDGIMHMAYIQKMLTVFPPNEPGAYALPLKNYHYWMDLAVAEIARVWYIPAHHIFYQFFPPLLSVMTGTMVYLLMRTWTGSKIAGLWALFFLYLAGDAAFVFMLALHHQFGFHTPAIDNGITQFANMPHATAKMLFMAGLLAFYNWIKLKEKKWGLLTVFIFAPLVGYKVYFGMFAAFGMTLVVIGKLFTRIVKEKKLKSLRKEYMPVGLLLLFAIIASAIFFPPNADSGGLGYYPLEWPKLFLGAQNLDMKEWWLRMQVYEQAENIRNIILFNTFAAIVGLICIHGTRLIGLFPHKSLVRRLGWEHIVFLVPGIILFQLLGLFTLQKAGSFNVFNFFVVSTSVMALFSAYVLYDLTVKKKIWATMLIIIVVILTMPRAMYESYTIVNALIHRNSGNFISSQELEALAYVRLKTPANAIIQPHINNANDNASTYVAYISGRDTYLSGYGLIESHGQPVKPLLDELQLVFKISDQQQFIQRAKKAKISYLYLKKHADNALPFVPSPKYFSKLFENKDVIILELR